MRILAFRHFDFDDYYAFASWARKGGHRLEVRDPALGVRREWLDGLDLLIVCGGPMSVYEDAAYPWLAEEKLFVKQAVESGIKVLGICFGAQMLAELLGSPVFRGRHKEIGWHRVFRTEESHPWLEELDGQFVSFQWHGDTFELPEETRLLAYSEAYRVQAFSYQEHVLGLQFHLETTPACMEEMIGHWSAELTDAPYIQSEEQIRRESGRSGQSIDALHRILDRISAQGAVPKEELYGEVYPKPSI